MLYVESDGTIGLTRGDTARLKVDISNEATGGAYTIGEGDTLTFSVKKSVNDSRPCVQKVVKGSGAFHLEPADTRALVFGNYLYDVQLTTAAGDVYTVVGPNTFRVLKEVTT